MPSVTETISRNLAQVSERIDAACRRAGRDLAEVTLVAVTKYAQLDWIRAIVSLGVTQLGENRPQQLAARAAEIAGCVDWHLIGHLQRNKVRLVLPKTTLIHSVDSVRLLEAIDRVASELDLTPRVLLEVNLSGESAKHGFARAELVAAWPSILKFQRIRLEGFMTMAAYSSDPEAARPVFARLRELRDDLRRVSPSDLTLPHLSMGMTGDFEVAVEEGATLVRIGSALWDGLGD